MESWTEKYRPKTLNQIIGNRKAVEELKKWGQQWDQGIPRKKAVILSGKAGTGKTSSALALANQYRWTVIELNASDARNASRIKKVATFGAINETFDNTGQFISSKKGGRKLIILDEADNLYERLDSSEKKQEKDYSDKGGKKAIVETIEKTNQPIVLIVNDYYGLIKGSGGRLKKTCKLIKFYNPYPSKVFTLLRRICFKEKIKVNHKVLKTISEACKGDVRSAIQDLQSICLNKKQVDYKSLNALGYRDKEKIIFDTLRDVFKTNKIKSIKESLLHTDIDPNTLLLWLNENLPVEYKHKNDLARGYDKISKADVFLGRTHRRQSYRLWSYAQDIMNGGVATAKTHKYTNKRYNFPKWLRMMKDSKNIRSIRKNIIEKISKNCHVSSNKAKNLVLPYLKKMFINDVNFAVKIKQKFDFSEKEIEFIAGKKNLDKVKEILRSSEKGNEVLTDKKDENKEQKEKNKKLQKKLFSL
ncbi:MAG: replication factor C large subunit [Candidatus Thermoplasmatota archaeon]